MTKLYYTAPKDKQFEEVKQFAKKLWFEVDTDHDKYGYASEKVNCINTMQNIGDNFMYIVAMFDSNNQAKLAEKLSQETKDAIHDRITDGGGFDYIFS